MPPNVVFIVATEDDVHADAVVERLNQLAVPVFRFHANDFPERTAINLRVEDGRIVAHLKNAYHEVSSDQVVSAWYRRSGQPSISDAVAEGARKYCAVQCNETLKAVYASLEGKWVASPHALMLAEIKPLQLAAAAQAGLRTPPTLITNDPDTVLDFHHELRAAGRDCAVKTLRMEGANHEGHYRFPLTAIWDGSAPKETLRYAPAVYQPYVPKSVELRCVLIGSEVYAAAVYSQRVPAARIDVRVVEELDYEPHELPQEVKDALLKVARCFSIQFASADLILTPDGEYVFLELNPGGQWLWLVIEAGLPLVDAMANLLAGGVSSAPPGGVNAFH